MSTMVGAGVESVRAAFNWAAAQPTEAGPYDFSQTDMIVGDAARDGLTVLPVVLYTPSWDARPNPSGTIAIPQDDAPYAAYLTALVKRYGPNGTYWADNPALPKRPIREWQIWNEPNFTYYWPTRPFAPSYVALVKAADAAIKRADPGAEVVLAGMPNDAWNYLQKIYDVPHAGRYFDVVAVHPYTVIPSNVILFLQKMRAVMKRNGDARKPIVVTEMGWNSSIGHKPSDDFCCQSTAARQAAKVKAVLPLLAQNRAALKLQAFYYYTWASHGTNGGPSANWAGHLPDHRLHARPQARVRHVQARRARDRALPADRQAGRPVRGSVRLSRRHAAQAVPVAARILDAVSPPTGPSQPSRRAAGPPAAASDRPPERRPSQGYRAQSRPDTRPPIRRPASRSAPNLGRARAYRPKRRAAAHGMPGRLITPPAAQPRRQWMP